MDVEQLTQPEALEEFHEVRHGFDVAGHGLLIAKGGFSQVVSDARICPIPSTPEWFCGFINHRGETVPVFDIAGYVSPAGHSESGAQNLSKQNNRWVLLLDEHPQMVGILLDKPPEGLVSPVKTEVAPDDQDPLSPFKGDCYKHQGRMWTEFFHEQFFTSLKQQF